MLRDSQIRMLWYPQRRYSGYWQTLECWSSILERHQKRGESLCSVSISLIHQNRPMTGAYPIAMPQIQKLRRAASKQQILHLWAQALVLFACHSLARPLHPAVVVMLLHSRWRPMELGLTEVARRSMIPYYSSPMSWKQAMKKLKK